MEVIEKNENQIVVTSDISESLANTIRRYIYEIPVLAIEEVEIFKNDSALYDETIAHRMGLIPLKMENSFDEKTVVELKLAKKEGTVYSGDLKGGAKIVFDKIPITILNKDQEIELTATAKLGRGIEHSKYSPGMIYYRNINEIELDKELVEEVKKVVPKLNYKESGKKAVILDNQKTEVQDACEEACKKHGKDMKVTPKKEIVIVVESFGQLETKEIVLRSIKELKKDLNAMSKHVDKM